ncbi:hypothetical protein HN415_08495 [Candidatus Woesearchaeota archaeon]|jgi:hypothetical protein|nr:hypothetical protein [Candidatus Woesearchaeota archaeon]
MVKKIFDRPPEVRFWFFSKTLLQSLNPFNYYELSSRPVTKSSRYLFGLIMFSSIILGMLIILNMISFHNSFGDELSKLKSLELNTSLNEPIEIEKYKFAFVNERNYTNENLLITNKEIVRKPTFCSLLKPACLINRDPVITDYTNLQDHIDDLGNFLLVVFLLMFPGLLLLYLIYMMLKIILIIGLLSIITHIITRLMKYPLRFSRILLCALYSSSILVLLEPINIMALNLYYIHVILFISIFIAGLTLVIRKSYRYKNV